MKCSENINEIAKAMSNAQGEMQPALKSANNPFYKSRYADFASVWEAIREPMKKNELSVWQDVTNSEYGICVSTRVTHSSGQWVEFGPLEIPIPKKDAQSVGSAISYAKRYSLSAAVGVVADIDDDGEKAMGREQNKREDKQTVYINKEQVNELVKILDECEPEYVKRIEEAFGQLGIQSYAQIKESSYNKYIQSAKKNRDEYQSRMRKAS